MPSKLTGKYLNSPFYVGTENWIKLNNLTKHTDRIDQYFGLDYDKH